MADDEFDMNEEMEDGMEGEEAPWDDNFDGDVPSLDPNDVCGHTPYHNPTLETSLRRVTQIATSPSLPLHH